MAKLCGGWDIWYFGRKKSHDAFIVGARYDQLLCTEHGERKKIEGEMRRSRAVKTKR